MKVDFIVSSFPKAFFLTRKIRRIMIDLKYLKKNYVIDTGNAKFEQHAPHIFAKLKEDEANLTENKIQKKINFFLQKLHSL